MNKIISKSNKHSFGIKQKFKLFGISKSTYEIYFCIFDWIKL